MNAVDTNVLVRVLTNDDPEQSPRAAAFLAREPVIVPTTVLLECEWVLRYAYGLTPRVICEAFRMLLGLPTVTAESTAAVAQALTWYEKEMDFADALHVATGLSAGATGFVTFDRALARRAAGLGAAEVIEPQSDSGPRAQGAPLRPSPGTIETPELRPV